MEENNKMGKTRDVFKKIGDIKKTFHARMGMIIDRNSKDLTEGKEIKKRWQEYTEELYQKDFNDPDNLDGVITHLEPDILESRGALGSIALNKASGSDGIPAELFQVLKDDAISNPKKAELNMPANLENSEWPQDWKMSVFTPISKKVILKNVQTTIQLHSFHMLVSLCSKSFKLDFINP